MNTDNLWTLSQCAKETGYDFRYLQYYKNVGRFLKPKLKIGTKEYYDKDQALKWVPKLLKTGRKPK